MIASVICGIIVLIAIFGIIVIVKKEKLKLCNKKILASKEKIEKALEEKLSILVELQNEFSKEKKFKDFKLKLKSKYDDDYFKLNSILNNATREVKEYIESKRKCKINDAISNLLLDLNNKEIECNAYKKYYNDNALVLNSLINKFLFSSIAKCNHIQRLELYNDPIEEEFEILKKK